MWKQVDAWLSRRGLRMVVHRKVPARKRRWIGVIHHPGAFQGHCIVMCHDRFLFDPLSFMDEIRSPGQLPRARRYKPEDITYGVSFARHNQDPDNRRSVTYA